jgi:rhodanese-related sulfurtransferase
MFPPDVPSVAATAVSAQATVLDVREDDEWQAGHIDGALHIPLGDVPSRVAEIPEQDEIVVVCRAGGRSARAVAWLLSNGVDAVNLDGGMGAWADAGRPMVSETGDEPFVR